MEKLLNSLIDVNGILNYWKFISSKLPKKDENIKFVDFDDTLFSRDEQLENEKQLREKRGHEGAKFIFEKIGIEKFLDKYYKNRIIPKGILNTMDEKKDVILTAGIAEFQLSKIKQFRELDKFKVIVTKSSKEKVLRLIRYILFELKYIPKIISVYEDRPAFFIEYKNLIEKALNTKIEIYYVIMDENNGYTKIEKITGL